MLFNGGEVVGTGGVVGTRREGGGVRGLAGESGLEMIRSFEGFRGENWWVYAGMFDVWHGMRNCGAIEEIREKDTLV